MIVSLTFDIALTNLQIGQEGAPGVCELQYPVCQSHVYISGPLELQSAVFCNNTDATRGTYD